MHIVHCLSRGDVGGAQAVVYTLVSAMRDFYPHTKSTVVLPPNGMYVREFAKLGVPTILLPTDRLGFFTFVRAMNILSSLDADVVHSHGKGAGLYMRWFSNKNGRVRRVHSYHGVHLPAGALARSSYLFLESYLLHRTDAILAISEGEAREIRQMFPRASGRIFEAGNVVDREDLRRRSAIAIETKLAEFLGAHTSSTIVTMIGRNDPVKNFPLAFDASQLACRSCPSLALIFVGIPEEMAGFQSLKAGFPDRVLAIPRLDNTAPLFARSDAVLLTSKKEGRPLVVLEAFSLGKPVVATNVEGIRDLVTDGYNGLLADSDAPSIASALVSLATDKTLRSLLGENARKTSDSFNVKDWCDRYYEIYSWLAKVGD
jgi:glycosyltransferase involved in cell wall biosynthesis